MDTTVQLITQICLALSFCGSFLLALYIYSEVKRPMGESAYLLMHLSICCTLYSLFRFIEGSMYTITAPVACKIFAMLSYTFSTLMCIWSTIIIFHFFTYQLENIGLIRERRQSLKDELLTRPKVITSKTCKYILLTSVYLIPLIIYPSLLFSNHITRNSELGECVITSASMDMIYWLPSCLMYIISLIIVILTFFVMKFRQRLQISDENRIASLVSVDNQSSNNDDSIPKDERKYNDETEPQKLNSITSKDSMWVELYKDSRFADEIGTREILTIIMAYLVTWCPSGIRDFLRIMNVHNNIYDDVCAIMTHLYGFWIGLFCGYFMSKSEHRRKQIGIHSGSISASAHVQHAAAQNVVANVICWYHWLGWVWLFIIRGSVFLAIKILEPDIPPLVIVSGRLCIGSLFLCIFIGIRAMFNHSLVDKLKILTKKSILIRIMIFSILKSYIPWVLLSYGETNVPSGIASILLSIGPIVATLSSMIVLKKPITFLTVMGIIVSCIGTVVVFEQELSHFSSNSMFHYGLIIIAACFYGGSKAYAKKYISKKEYDVTVVAFGAMLCACFISVIMSMVIEFPKSNFDFFARVSTLEVSVLVLLGICSAGLSAIVYFWCLSVMGPVKVAFTAYLVPIVGVLEGVLIGNEWHGKSWLNKISEIVGLSLILAGFYLMKRSK